MANAFRKIARRISKSLKQRYCKLLGARIGCRQPLQAEAGSALLTSDAIVFINYFCFNAVIIC
jgi:hypothetical protein